MPNNIVFSAAEPTDDVFDRDCLTFRARVDETIVVCYVSLEFLMARFGVTGVTEKAMREAFHAHRAEIEAIARSHIENGWVDEQNRVYLTPLYPEIAKRGCGSISK